MQLLKRDFKLLMKGLLPALLLTGFLLLVCGLAGFSALKAGTDLIAPVPVALVDEEDSFASRLCIGIVQDAEYVDDLLTIEKCSRNDAVSGIEKGRFAAAIILPDGYTELVMRGQECVGTIILSEEAAGMSSLVSRIAELAERLLAAGQYGVFAGEELILSGNVLGEGDYFSFLALSNTRLIDVALDLENEAFETVVLPYSGFGTDVASHFVLCWMCFFMSVCGMFFTSLYNADRDEALRDRLRSCGIGNFAFISGKVIWPWVFRILLWGGMMLLLKRFINVEITGLTAVCCAAGLLLCSCFTGGLALAFPKGAPWIVLMVSIGGLFFCGGLLPLQFIPHSFFSVGRISPLGAMAGVISPAFDGKITVSAAIAAVFWAAAALVLAFMALSRRHGRGEAV